MKFRFVDRIVSWTPNERIRGRKAVSFEEYELKAAFGGGAHLPPSLLLESFLQLGNWLILLSTDFAHCGLIVRLDEVHFDGEVGPGDQVDMEVVVVRRRDDGWELAGEGGVGSRLVIRGAGCLAAPVPTTELYDPADLRVRHAELARTPEAVR